MIVLGWYAPWVRVRTFGPQFWGTSSQNLLFYALLRPLVGRLGWGTRLVLATAVIAYLLAGPAGFGLLGWLLDALIGTEFLLPVGVVLGMVLSMYVIWVRYGRP